VFLIILVGLLHIFINRVQNVKPRDMRWAGYVAHIGEKRNAYGVLV
jgi:hypothetical protein